MEVFSLYLFFSLSFFLILLLSMFGMISHKRSSVSYTKTDSIIVSISMDDSKITRPPPKPVKKEEDTDDEVIDESFDDIFESIDTEKIIYSKNTKVKESLEKVDQEFLKKIQTRKNIKSTTHKTKKRTLLETKSLEESKFNSKEKALKKSGGEKNIYYAKVQDVLYQGWHQPSQSFQQSLVIIKISSSGIMRYVLKQVSGDMAFDKALKAHLEYLLDTIFPVSPDGLSVTFKTYFKSKEQ